MADSIFNPQGKKTLLTVDGGGARGIIPLMVLKRLEDVTGQRANELFDFVGGTSVGALIAAGLAAGRSASEMIELYDRFVQLIFKKDWLAIIFKHGLRYLYDKDEMRALLLDYVGDVRLNDLETIILLTVKDMARAETIFFVNRGPGAAVTGHASLARVAEASATAPVYFEPLGDAVDGGVGTYGNACYVATVEALEYLGEPGWEDGNIIHVSLGTGLSLQRLERGEARRWMPWQWPLWVVDELLEEATDNNVRLTVRHYGDRIDFRRYQVSLYDDIVRGELGVAIPPGVVTNDLGMDSASPEAVMVMREIGKHFAAGIDFSLTGKQLLEPGNAPPGYAGAPYRPARLPALTPEEVDRMLGL
ncbi:MAG: hypothetical protein Kow0077_09390 [Anaerolineae bacterium]